MPAVALRTEGVDRNKILCHSTQCKIVALRTEGVDRNQAQPMFMSEDMVALRTEGVDRNIQTKLNWQELSCRPPHGGRG